ncbi:ROK family protein [Actinomyces bowdenii]|uniref:ROK family protein n=1 Tax=Actinomyces bowdenii TaxID=131109 RepID=A0A3P1UWA7_9ACTO|nr:ROK family protein [Actinomyces bowdenii]RRD25630.1 ROK family protein [Actinomyces bowdenii]
MAGGPTGPADGGPAPRALPASRCALGIDVGGTAIKAVLCDARGALLSSLERPTPRDLAGLKTEVGRAVAELRGRIRSGQVRHRGEDGGAGGPVVDQEDLVPPVGLAVPGIVREPEGIAVHSANLGWRDLPMRDLMEEELGLPVVLSHDVRAGAWAEGRWGAGGTDFLYLAIGTGIASVLVLNGSPVDGGGWAGEVGLMPVPDPDHPGASARLESVASASAMARRRAAALPGGLEGAPGRAVLCEGSLGVLRAMEAGDERAARVWGTALDALAGLITTGALLLGPLDVVIGGGLARAGQERLLTPLRQRVSRRLELVPVPRVLPAALGPWSQALGSAGRAMAAHRGARAAAGRGPGAPRPGGG